MAVPTPIFTTTYHHGDLRRALVDAALEAAARNPALSPFPTSRREIAHGPHWTSTMEYSVAGDAAIDAIIQSLVVDDCYPSMMIVDDGRREQWVCETRPQCLKARALLGGSLTLSAMAGSGL